MKRSSISLAALLMASSVLASAQSRPAPESDSTIEPPADRGVIKNPESSSMSGPSNSGIVVVPPRVDSGAVKTPPENIDPKIKDATGDVDRKNREESEEKSGSQ